MQAQFNREQFDASFAERVASLAASEKVSKELLRSLSRDVIEAHHATGDVAYINELLGACSSINRKVGVLFFKEFSGHLYSEETKSFGKKDKKRYDDAKKKSFDRLEDPNFNLFSWADMHVEIEKKPFTLGKMQQQMGSLIKKAEGEKISHADIIRAVLANGIEVAEFMKVVEHMAEEQHPANEPAPL